MKISFVTPRLLIFSFLTVFFSCNQNSNETKQQEINKTSITVDSLAQKLEPVNRQIEKAIYESDYDKLITFYCDDVVIKPSNHRTIKGISELRESYAENKKAGVKILSFTPKVEKLWASGNEIYEYGYYAMAITYSASTVPRAYSGSYFMIWEAQSGSLFKIKYMMSNFDFMPDH